MLILKLGSKLNIAGSVYDVVRFNKKTLICNNGRSILELKLSEIERELLETKNWKIDQL